MVSSAPEHYDRHLGHFYAWMVGDFDVASSAATRYFESLRLSPRGNRVAVDLGSGHGVQTLPLARAGFEVVAIDTCRELLDELETRAGDLTVRPVRDDLLHFPRHLDGNAEVIICMGDTLTHLASVDEVTTLLRQAHETEVDDVAAAEARQEGHLVHRAGPGIVVAVVG